MSLNLLEQSCDKLSDLILKQQDTSVKRELSIIRGKIAIYLKYYRRKLQRHHELFSLSMYL